jgi:hypothetical protein
MHSASFTSVVGAGVKKTRLAEQYSVIESNENFLIYKSICPIVPFYSPLAKILSQERTVN